MDTVAAKNLLDKIEKISKYIEEIESAIKIVTSDCPVKLLLDDGAVKIVVSDAKAAILVELYAQKAQWETHQKDIGSQITKLLSLPKDT